ncbi:MBOAT family O-acyltransferase [Aestuariivivens sediminis]|uniref:MBOAT family O-acyltransferase n=1 Tax=Aestuariivivens sediminis TaxID=2913557 RepID=UPI001F56CDAC|nr:MBOAT family O-acyltransferase [Aestuariivivens sediminis]
MLFNSLAFALFLPLVFLLYWFVFNNSLKWQNLLIVVASYVFYGWWDYRFLILIAFSTVVDYVVGKQMEAITKTTKRKLLLGISLVCNLGLLGFFKYYNFFVDTWAEAWLLFGISMERSTLNIILPVGISFYTFQTLSYTIDVYRKKVGATKDLMQFAAYVSFFPQLVAGPIERANQFLPQFRVKRKFDTVFALRGFNLIIWGLFKKMVVADNCAFFVNQIFDHPENHNSMTLFFGAILFGFQIYGDFSGYSDIAIGTGRLFGFRLMTNFKFPYFSRDVAEFWRRWHISLSTWFRDYLYIPMGGSRGTFKQKIRNVLVVFLVSGFWHGANWTFALWGGLHALFILPLFIVKKNRKHIISTRFSVNQIFKISFTFCLVTLAWVFFRADNIELAFEYVMQIFNFSGMALTFFVKTPKIILFSLIVLFSSIVLLMFEFLAVQKNEKEVVLSSKTAFFIGLMILFMGIFKNPETFIYFQF